MTLAVEQYGQGPGLVLVHGWGMNGGVWAPLRDRLAKHWTVTSIELPGHGRSGFDIGATLSEWADALLAAAPERAIWLGWSLGGQLSLAIAGRAPDRCRGLVLATTNPCFVASDVWPTAMPAETFQAFAQQLGLDAGRTLDRFLALQVRGADAATETLRQLRLAIRERPAPQAAALAAGLDLLLANDLRDCLQQLAVPSMWLFGDRDALVPAAAADAVQALTPQAHVQRIAAAGHAPFLSHPQTCVDLLMDFAEHCSD